MLELNAVGFREGEWLTKSLLSIWYYWLVPLLLVSFLWRVNEWRMSSAKRQISGVLIVIGLGICLLIGRLFDVLLGGVSFFIFFLSAAFFHYPAEVVARWINKMMSGSGR